MSRNDQDGSGSESPETALEEVLREVEPAETRDSGAGRERRRGDGEGDATSPDAGAQGQSRRD